MRLGVSLFVGLLCFLRVCIALEFGFVSLGLHCQPASQPRTRSSAHADLTKPLFSAGFIVVLVAGCSWAYSAFSVLHPRSSRAATKRPGRDPPSGVHYKDGYRI